MTVFCATGADLDRLAAHAIASGHGFAAEVFMACRRGEMAAAYILRPDTPAPMKLLRRAMLPVIAIISDDPGDAGLGPSAWLATRRLVDWASFAIVHGAGGTVADYRMAVDLTKSHRRLLLIECSSTRADEWAGELLRRKPRPVPFFGILPKDGQHPVTLAREAMP